ncbi:hypothetical protein WJX73_000303 [Symbiochloris irregularis]|uniref:Leucine-rich repeat-containing N-terminal plant-type domain-containing protein n=1 Tax=Symbiochloris irregularis TaxID=706552 RepID=A0AAW1NNB0_9CHLO
MCKQKARHMTALKSCQRQRRSADHFGTLVFLCAIACLPNGCKGQTPPTDATDKQVLLAFKDAASDGVSQQGLLDTWNPDTDPCQSNWLGIECSCIQVFQPSGNCNNTVGNASHVYGILLGDTFVTHGGSLQGSLTPQLGLLSELRYLDLRGLGLQGQVPEELGNASRLSQLLLSGNDLSGGLPGFVTLSPNLLTAALNDNNFSGVVPSSWCAIGSNNDTQIDLSGNARLCGSVPACLGGQLISIQGTGLYVPDNPAANPSGSVCDIQPPSCNAGCGIMLPSVWTNVRTITFNFTAFQPPPGYNGNITYSWGLGSDRELADVLPLRPFNGTQRTLDNFSIGGTDLTDVTVYATNYTLALKALLGGQDYWVVVQGATQTAFNNATNTTAGPIRVDAAAPTLPSSGHIYTGQNCQPSTSQTATNYLSACWTPFEDPSGGSITSYSVQGFVAEIDPITHNPITGANISDQVPVNLATRYTLQRLHLRRGKEYLVRVMAIDETGVSGFADSAPLSIVGVNHSLAPGQVTAIVASTVIVSCFVVGILSFFILKHRFQGKAAEKKHAREKAKQFKGLLSSLNTSTAGAGGVADELNSARQLAFVVTDMESSTAMADANTHAFSRLQEIHDAVMREGIARYGGYEIGTEGDSFHVAFRTVADAVHFCMEVQMVLLETNWPREVLKLGPCKMVADSTSKEVLFRGPRGLEYHFHPPPALHDRRGLALVSLCLPTSLATVQNADSQSAHTTLMTSRLRLLGVGTSNEVPAAVAEALREVLAIVAMQFQGYFFQQHPQLGRFMVAFPSSLEALRFCHAAQLGLMYRRWPNERGIHNNGRTEFAPDGRLLFAGPRMAMAVHESADFKVEQEEGGDKVVKWEGLTYVGPAVAFAQRLGQAAHGGQVVLSGSAWASVQDSLPGLSQVISLGTHQFHNVRPDPSLIMEVMPAILARRTFPRLQSDGVLDPGFRESPDPTFNMAILFIKVSRPAEVLMAEQAMGPGSDDDIVRTLTAFNMGVAKVSRLVRRLLPKFRGYECKEPEPGKFTLAFRFLQDAIRWCAAVQADLLDLNWPPLLLTWDECREVQCPASDDRVWRGLKVSMGLAYGKPQYRKPLSTGRADYYGTLPNLAARVMSMAAPGQVLVEASPLVSKEMRISREDSAACYPLASQPSEIDVGDENDEKLRMELLGCYLLKGFDDPKVIYQVIPYTLRERTFESPKNAARVSHLPRRPHKLGGALDGMASLLGAGALSGSENSCSSPRMSRGPGLLSRTGSSTAVRAVGTVLGTLHCGHGDGSSPRWHHRGRDTDTGSLPAQTSNVSTLQSVRDVEEGGAAHELRASMDGGASVSRNSTTHGPNSDAEILDIDSPSGSVTHPQQPPWGSFVGRLTRRMRHYGLPLGRPSAEPLTAADAALAASHKQAALQEMSKMSAAHAKAAAEMQDSVRQSLAGYAHPDRPANDLAHQSAPSPRTRASSGTHPLHHSASSPASSDPGGQYGDGSQPGTPPSSRVNGAQGASSSTQQNSHPLEDRGQLHHEPLIAGSAPPTMASPFSADFMQRPAGPRETPSAPASASPTSRASGDSRSPQRQGHDIGANRGSYNDMTAFGSTDLLNESYAREIAQLFLAGRNLGTVATNNSMYHPSYSGHSVPTSPDQGSTSAMLRAASNARATIELGLLSPTQKESSFDFGPAQQQPSQAAEEPVRRSISLDPRMQRTSVQPSSSRFQSRFSNVDESSSPRGSQTPLLRRTTNARLYFESCQAREAAPTHALELKSLQICVMHITDHDASPTFHIIIRPAGTSAGSLQPCTNSQGTEVLEKFKTCTVTE